MKRHISIFTLLLGAFAALGAWQAVADDVVVISDRSDLSVSGISEFTDSGVGYYYGRAGASSNLTLASVPSGYRFLGWYTMEDDDDNSRGEGTSPAKCTRLLTSNKTITAEEIGEAATSVFWGTRVTAHIVNPKFKKIWAVTTAVSPDGSGSVDVSGGNGDGTVDDGGSVTLTATPKAGWTFSKWSDNVTDGRRTLTSVSGNISLTALFAPKGYSVSQDPENAVITVAQTGTYTADLPISWQPASAAGYDYTFVSANVLNGNTTLASYTSGTSATFNMQNVCGQYYSSVTIAVKYTKTGQDRDLKFQLNEGIETIGYKIGNDSEWTVIRADKTIQIPVDTKWQAYATPKDGYIYTATTPEKPHVETMGSNGAIFSPTHGGLDGYRLTVDPNGGFFNGSKEKFTFNLRLREGFTNLNEIGTVTFEDGSPLIEFRDEKGEPVYDAAGHNVGGTYWTADYPNGKFRGTGDLTVKAIPGQPTPRFVISTSVQPDEEAGTAEGAGTYEEGSNIVLKATANAGYSFWHWTKDDVEVSTNTEYPLTVTANEEYAAVFTGNVYTVTCYAMNAQMEIIPYAVTYGSLYGELPSPTPPAGKNLDGWYTSPSGAGDKITAETKVTTASDHTLFANWIDKTKFDVVYADPSFANTWITNSVDRNHEITDVEARTVTKNWPGRRGNEYWIKGWNPTLPLTVAKDETISAVWESYADVLDCTNLMFSVSEGWKPYAADYVKGDSCMRLESQNGVLLTTVTNSGTLTFHWRGGYIGSKATELQVKVGEGANPETFTSTSGMGWVPTNVFISATGPTKVEFSCKTVSDFCQIDFVTWEEGKGPEKSYTISFDANGGSGPVAKFVCKEGKSFTFPDNGFTPPDEDAVFVGWNENADCSGATYSPSDTFKPSADRTFYAKWRYKITYKPGTYSRGQDYSDTKDHGASATLRDKSYDHTSGALYAQDGWSVNEDGSTSDYELKATYSANESVTLYPHWKQIGVSDALDCPALEFSASGGWSIVEDPSAVNGSCMRLAVHDMGNAITVEIRETGKLSFDWKGVYEERPTKMNVYIGDMETPADVCEATSEGMAFATFGPYEITASSDNPVVVKFAGVKSNFKGCSLDHVVWMPEGGEPTPGEPVEVTEAGVADGVFKMTIWAENETDYGVWTNADLTVDSWGLMGKPQPGKGQPLEFKWTIVPGFPQLFFRAHEVEYK